MFTTIGYGDIVPMSLAGRIICFMAVMFGSSVISLFIVTISNVSSLNKEERKCYKQITLWRAKNGKLHLLAGKFIKAYLLYMFRRKMENRREQREARSTILFF